MTTASARRILSRTVSPTVLALAGATIGLYLLATLSLQPPFDTMGDAPGYLQAMQVVNGMTPPLGFTPNRILTTFGGVTTVALLARVTGNYLASWYFINTFYFFGLSFVSYALLRRLTQSGPAAALGALFIVGNYDVLVFGLNYLMDLSGWFWFMLSLYGTYRYTEAHERRWLWLAALAAGIGTLFKEYAFFGFAPLGLYLLYAHLRQPRDFVRSLVPLIASLVPLALVHLGVFLTYGYTYADWYRMNTSTFAWNGWLRDFSRSVIIVLTFLAPITGLGLIAFVREMRASFDARRVFFMVSLVVPALAVFLWPIITERLVYLVVPLAAALGAFAVKHNERHWEWFAFVWLLYVLLALRTDAMILSVLYAV